MKNKLPTAQEFLLQELPHRFITISVKEEIHKAMIKFASLHCIEQARIIIEKAEIKYTDGSGDFVDEDSILNAYNLDNIK